MPPDPSNLKDKTVTELFALTLEGDFDDEDNNMSWEAVSELRRRATPEIFKTSVEFCNSDDPLKRARGIDVLAQFGWQKKEPPYLDERVTIAAELLNDKEEIVVEAASAALTHMKGKKAVAALLTVQRSSNAKVRWNVALGLYAVTAPEAVEALIELMQDDDDIVREWATFALGGVPDDGHSLDTPEIREAFRDRLSDSDERIRDEAVCGLAKRKDPEGLRMLLERLEAGKWAEGVSCADAASYLLDAPYDTDISELCDGLHRLLAELERKNSS